MPYTYPTLIDAQTRSMKQNEKIVLTTIFKLAQVMPLFPTALRPNMKSTQYLKDKLPAAQHRALNASFNSTRSAPGDPLDTGIAIGGWRFEVDPELADIPQDDGGSYANSQARDHNEGFALDMTKHMIGRAPTTNEPKGMYGWANQFNTVNNPQIVPINSSLAKLSALNHSQIVQKINLAHIRCGGPNVGFANDSVLRGLEAHALFSSDKGYQSYIKMITVPIPGKEGMTMDVMSYRGVPILPIGNDSQNAAIMPFDEDNNGVPAASSGSSIVWVRFGMSKGTKMLLKRPAPLVESGTENGRKWWEMRFPYNFESPPNAVTMTTGIQTE